MNMNIFSSLNSAARRSIRTVTIFQLCAFRLVREGQGGERAGGSVPPRDGRGRLGAGRVSAPVGVDERRRSLLAAPEA